MPNRYKTAAEIAGARRRTKAYQDRLRRAGLLPRQYWLDDAENDRVKKIIKRWRGEITDLPPDLAEAADILKP